MNDKLRQELLERLNKVTSEMNAQILEVQSIASALRMSVDLVNGDVAGKAPSIQQPEKNTRPMLVPSHPKKQDDEPLLLDEPVKDMSEPLLLLNPLPAK